MYVRMYVCPHLCSVYTYVRSLVLFLNAVCEREALVHGATEKDSSYTFTYTRTFIRTYVCVHLYVCVCTYVCACMYVCVSVRTFVCVQYMPVVNPFTGVLCCTVHTYICTYLCTQGGRWLAVVRRGLVLQGARGLG